MKIEKTISLLLTACLASGTAAAAPVDDLLRDYQAAGAGPFTEASGARLWTQEHPEHEVPRSCATCHTPDPRKPGRHAVTGKAIEPLAPSTNHKRLSERSEIDKWLLRNCKWTLGRECTAQEKGDILTFLKAQ